MICKAPFVSALGCVYSGDRADWLEDALFSLVNQTRPPDEIVLVVDGFIDKTVNSVIDQFSEVLTVKRLEENYGLAYALNRGVEIAKGEVLIRYDSDDINDPKRIERLLEKYEELGENYIIGSWVLEFGFSNKLRAVPKLKESINKKLGYRCVLNHPSVLYPKSLILQLGGYEEKIFPEDYFLWLKARSMGFGFYNIQEPLVLMRTSDDFYYRRSGIKYAMRELEFYSRALELKLLTKKEVFLSVSVRMLFRLLPIALVRLIYIRILRK
jgi:glycosyltransferase involved in cell wall biosynthesis